MTHANDNVINLADRRGEKLVEDAIQAAFVSRQLWAMHCDHMVSTLYSDDFHAMAGQDSTGDYNLPQMPVDRQERQTPPHNCVGAPAALFHRLKRRIRKAWKYTITMLGG